MSDGGGVAAERSGHAVKDGGAVSGSPISGSPLAYPIFVHAGAIGSLGSIVREHAPAHRVVVISDTTVAALHGDTVIGALTDAIGAHTDIPIITIPPGESEKTRQRWAELTDALLERNCARDTTVVALGGGVVCDMAGFVAATYMRGIPVVQLPTTLLAMVDASVGGKTGVDSPHGKNLVGAFHDPRAVVIDPSVLRSLPHEVFRSGLAEIIKHGIIADGAYLDRVSRALPDLTTRFADAEELPAIIRDSVLIKANVVAQDRTERGLRKILNFGHTIAHALERASDYAVSHGEAVAVGMVVESRIAELAGVALAGLRDAVAEIVGRSGLPTRIGQLSDRFTEAAANPAALVALTHSDKKVRESAVHYSLPSAIGTMHAAGGDYSVKVTDSVAEKALSQS